MGCFLLK